MIETEMIADVMGGSAIVGSNLDSTAELSDAITEGLPKSTLRHTAMHIFGNTPAQTQFYLPSRAGSHIQAEKRSPE